MKGTAKDDASVDTSTTPADSIRMLIPVELRCHEGVRDSDASKTLKSKD